MSRMSISVLTTDNIYSPFLPELSRFTLLLQLRKAYLTQHSPLIVSQLRRNIEGLSLTPVVYIILPDLLVIKNILFLIRLIILVKEREIVQYFLPTMICPLTQQCTYSKIIITNLRFRHCLYILVYLGVYYRHQMCFKNESMTLPTNYAAVLRALNFQPIVLFENRSNDLLLLRLSFYTYNSFSTVTGKENALYFFSKMNISIDFVYHHCDCDVTTRIANTM